MAVPFTLLCRQDGRTALLAENRLLEYEQGNDREGSLAGTILLGRVERVLPDIKAAFVKIGQSKNGFLPLKEADSFHRTSGTASLMSGQEIIVQVKKDGKGEKGAFLTRDITLPGQYALLMPQNRFIGVSRRIEAPEDHVRAKALGRQFSDGRFGLIVRHAALFARAQDVQEEIEALWQEWLALKQQAARIKAPCVLRREASPAERLCRDYAARHPITQHTETELGQTAMEALWEGAHVDRQLRQALLRRVELPKGGSLVIDEREALTSIDVNTGSTVQAESRGQLPLEENLLAVPEIARQIRLRNLSGILLVDFIDMDSDLQRIQVQTAMAEALSDDRVKTVVHGFTHLGLLEITRKRTRESLRELLTQPCKACCETGRIACG